MVVVPISAHFPVSFGLQKNTPRLVLTNAVFVLRAERYIRKMQ